MSVLSQSLDKNSPRIDPKIDAVKALPKFSVQRAGEVFWGVASFALFLALGPFSALAVVFSLASLVSGQEGKAEPEAVR